MKQYLYDVITGRQSGMRSEILRRGLYPLNVLYDVAIRVIDWRYRHSTPKTLPCRVISVGNIVAGGTGKTVVVAAIARQYLQKGCRVAIVTRGYGGRYTGEYHVISDGKNVLTPASIAGDEAVMLTHQLPDIPIVIGKDRTKAGMEAIRRWHSEVLILDDAFQYRTLARDLDIVTINASQPWGTGRLLPCGTLRERKKALARSDLIILTHTDQVENTEPLRREIHIYAAGIPVVESVHVPCSLIRHDTGKPFPIDLVADKRVLAVCAIGNPSSFCTTLRALGANEIRLIAYPDHHYYSVREINAIQRIARSEGYEIIVTTDKDAVKLPTDLDWYRLKVELGIRAGESYWREITEEVPRAQPERSG